jgi:hypothetical protein
VVKWCSLVRVERREMKQLFHRRAGIESQSPVVTLMRASGSRAGGSLVDGSNGRGQPICFWKRYMQRDSVAVGVTACAVGGRSGR